MMRTKSPSLIPTAAVPRTEAVHLAAPRWAVEMLRGSPARTIGDDGRLAISVATNPDFSLVSARVHGIDSLSPAQVEQTTTDAYSAIVGQLGAVPARHPVRFWNYIPVIHRPSG